MPLPIQHEGNGENINVLNMGSGGATMMIAEGGGEEALAFSAAPFWTPTRIFAILLLLIDIGGYVACIYFAHQRRKRIKAERRGEGEEDSTTTSSTSGGEGEEDIRIFLFGSDDTSCLSGDDDDGENDDKHEVVTNDYAPVIEIEWLKGPTKQQSMSVDTESLSCSSSSRSASSSTMDEETGLLTNRAASAFLTDSHRATSRSYGSTACSSNSSD
jgi:hypothetical protein